MKLSDVGRAALLETRAVYVRERDEAKAAIERLQEDINLRQKRLADAVSAISDIDRDLADGQEAA